MENLLYVLEGYVDGFGHDTEVISIHRTKEDAEAALLEAKTISQKYEMNQNPDEWDWDDDEWNNFSSEELAEYIDNNTYDWRYLEIVEYEVGTELELIYG